MEVWSPLGVMFSGGANDDYADGKKPQSSQRAQRFTQREKANQNIYNSKVW